MIKARSLRNLALVNDDDDKDDSGDNEDNATKMKRSRSLINRLERSQSLSKLMIEKSDVKDLFDDDNSNSDDAGLGDSTDNNDSSSRNALEDSFDLERSSNSANNLFFFDQEDKKEEVDLANSYPKPQQSRISRNSLSKRKEGIARSSSAGRRLSSSSHGGSPSKPRRTKSAGRSSNNNNNNQSSNSSIDGDLSWADAFGEDAFALDPHAEQPTDLTWEDDGSNMEHHVDRLIDPAAVAAADESARSKSTSSRRRSSGSRKSLSKSPSRKSLRSREILSESSSCHLDLEEDESRQERPTDKASPLQKSPSARIRTTRCPSSNRKRDGPFTSSSNRTMSRSERTSLSMSDESTNSDIVKLRSKRMSLSSRKEGLARGSSRRSVVTSSNKPTSTNDAGGLTRSSSSRCVSTTKNNNNMDPAVLVRSASSGSAKSVPERPGAIIRQSSLKHLAW